jgi:hypothetical protein
MIGRSHHATTPTRQLSQLTTNSRRIAAFASRQAAKLTGSSSWIAHRGGHQLPGCPVPAAQPRLFGYQVRRRHDTDRLAMPVDHWHGVQPTFAHRGDQLPEGGLRLDGHHSRRHHGRDGQLITKLSSSRFTTPNVFIFRRDDVGDYPFRIVTTRFPKENNTQTVTFSSSAFASPDFEHREIGPFTVIVRVAA